MPSQHLHTDDKAETVLDLIRRQMAEAPDVIAATLPSWSARTRAALRLGSRVEDGLNERFDNIRFTPMATGMDFDDLAEGLRQATALLEECEILYVHRSALN